MKELKRINIKARLCLLKFLNPCLVNSLNLKIGVNTKILISALNDPNDLQSYSGKQKPQTFGKVKNLKTKPRPQSFNGEVCRDYISFIGIKDKVSMALELEITDLVYLMERQ